MKALRKYLSSLVVALFIFTGLATPGHAIPGSETINPSGGTNTSDGLKIEVSKGSFVITRNGVVQTYFEESTFNGVLLAVDSGDAIRTYSTPKYDSLSTDDFPNMIHISDTASNGGLTVTSEFYADWDESSDYGTANDLKLTIRYDYVVPNNYFTATYSVLAPTSRDFDLDLYHGIDMYLDGEDVGPGSSGEGLTSDFPGRYVIQENGTTGAVGGFIEQDHVFTSFYADTYSYITDKDAFTGAGARGPYYAEKLSDFANPDTETDIGVGVHFDLGTVSASTTVTRNANIIFSEKLEPAAARDYAGPIITDIGEDNIATPYQTYGGQTVRVDGDRLSGITKVFIDGKEGTVVSTADDHFVMISPEGLTPGTYDLVAQSSDGDLLTYLDGFIVTDASANFAVANAACDGVEPSWWTQRISDTQAKAYIKCPAVGEKYRILQQTGGSGSYDSIFVKTLTDENDTTQVFNEFGRYIVRTIDLEDINRIRITVDDVELWKVRYNNPPSGLVTY